MFERKGKRKEGRDPGNPRRNCHGLMKLEAKARKRKEREGMAYNFLLGRGQTREVIYKYTSMLLHAQVK